MNEEVSTERTIVRQKEDSEYVSVIIKRNDEVIRHPDDTLIKAIEEGIEQIDRTNFSLFLSSLAAGLILGFAAMSVAFVAGVFLDLDPKFIRLATAVVYPLGFIICIMSGTQLFTEHTATAVYPYLDKKTKFSKLLSLWGIILFGNFVGTLCSSYLIYLADGVIGIQAGTVYIAEHLLNFSFLEVFISAVLAGWLMAQGGWLAMSTSNSSSKIICIFIVTFIIGLGGLHHSIAGSAEIFSGLMHSEEIKIYDAFICLLAAVLGNLFGGSFFVGILNYGHIKKTQ